MLQSHHLCTLGWIFSVIPCLSWITKPRTEPITSLNVVILLLILSRYDCLSELYTDTTGLCPIVCPQTGWKLHSSNPFLWGWLLSVHPSIHSPACHDTRHCSDPGAALCTWPYWSSWSSLELTPQVHQVSLDVISSLQCVSCAASCHLQNCWGCTVSYWQSRWLG